MGWMKLIWDALGYVWGGWGECDGPGSGPEFDAGMSTGGGSTVYCYGEDGPAFNVDGTPMMGGGIDAHGHVFGQTDSSAF